MKKATSTSISSVLRRTATSEKLAAQVVDAKAVISAKKTMITGVKVRAPSKKRVKVEDIVELSFLPDVCSGDVLWAIAQEIHPTSKVACNVTSDKFQALREQWKADPKRLIRVTVAVQHSRIETDVEYGKRMKRLQTKRVKARAEAQRQVSGLRRKLAKADKAAQGLDRMKVRLEMAEARLRGLVTSEPAANTTGIKA